MASKNKAPRFSEIRADDADVEHEMLSQAQRTQIVDLFMKRVRDPKMRRMIMRYSTFLAESRDNDTFYSALYTFSLSENFDKVRQGYKDFALDAQDLSEFDPDAVKELRKLGEKNFESLADSKPKSARKKKK